MENNEDYSVSDRATDQMCYRELMEEYGSVNTRLAAKNLRGWLEGKLESRRNSIAVHVAGIVYEAFQMGIGPEAMGAAGVFPVRELKGLKNG